MAKRKPATEQKKTPEARAGDFDRFVRLSSWLIFALGFALYANTLFFNYAVDDAIVIYDNEFTCKGAAGIPDLLRYDTFRGFFKVEGKESLVAGGRYRPLTPVMYALEVQFFAPKKKDAVGEIVKDKNGNTLFDPNEDGRLNAVKFIGHLVNVLLYALTGVVLYLLLLKMFAKGERPKSPYGYAAFVALAATLLFVVHPIHTEVVANVKGRDEIVSLLGSLAAVYFSLKAFFEKKSALNITAGVLFFLALMSKENAITFLAIVPLVFIFFTSAKWKRILTTTVPYVIGAAVFLIIRGSILGWDVAGEEPRELMNNPFLKLVGGQYVDFSSGEKFATIFYTLGRYLQLLVFPLHLSHDYYPRAIPIMSFGNWQVILCALMYLGLGIFALLRFSKKDPVSFGILFFLIALSIASNLLFPIGTNMSERFVYMPSIGFAIVVAVLFYRLTEGRVKPKSAALLAGIAILVLLSAKTFMRNFAWKDNFTLFTTDIQTVPNSAKLRNAVGGELIAQAIKPENAARKNEMLREATQHLSEAAKIHPGYKNAFLLLGNAYNYLQQYEASIQAFEQALRLDSGYSEANNNLGITYREAGKFYGEQKGDLDKALTYLSKAYEMRPDDYEVLRLLGVAYGVGGNSEKAVEFFTKALALQPDNADALFNLGVAWINAGQQEKGLEFIQKAKEIKPDIENERRSGKQNASQGE